MKPENLLDAMKYISADYITEAKPNTNQHNESRVKQPDAHSAPEKILIREDRRAAANGSGKEITMRTTSQRIITSIAAAAACAVFVGGGIFIAMQSKQNRPDPANSGNDIIEQSGKNFLGGTGEIHSTDTMELMYDDSRVYFSCGYQYADRNGSDVNEIRYNGDYMEEFMTHVFWDGEQFYYAEGESLYRLNNDGTHEETPFFSVSSYYPMEELEQWPEFRFTHILKLAGNYYSVRAVSSFGQTAEDDWRAYYCLFNAETGKSEIMPFDVEYSGFLKESDDSILFKNPETCGLTRYTFSTKSRKDIPLRGFKFDGNDLLLQGNTVYGFFSSVQDASAQVQDFSVSADSHRFGKVDLSTGNCTVIEAAPPEISQFTSCGDRIFTVLKGGMFLTECDPEWQNTDTLCYYDDIKPERFNDAPEAEWDPDPMKFAVAADETYVDVRLDPGSDAQRDMLYDRTTGKTTFYYMPHEDSAKAVTTVVSGTAKAVTTVVSGTAEVGVQETVSTSAVTDPANASELREPNVFGGYGKIRPVCTGTYSSDYLFRDDEYYYEYLHTEESNWYRFPLEGGSGTPLPKRLNGAQQPGEFISDGTNTLTKGLVPVSGGEMYPSMDAIRTMLNADPNNENDYLNCVGIWQISNRYFMFLRRENQTGQELSRIFIWLDSSGNVLQLNEEQDPADEYGSCLSDEEHEHMFYCRFTGNGLRNSEIKMLPDPGLPNETYRAPADLAEIGCISGGKTIYTDTAGKLCCTDEDGNKKVLSDSGADSSIFVRNDTVYYLTTTGDAGALTYLNTIDLKNGSGVPVENYSTGEFTQFWGFAESNNSAGFEIVLNLDLDKFVFLDPETHAIVRTLK